MFATDHTFQSRHCYPKLVCGDRGGVFTHCLRCPHCTLTTTRMYVAFYTFCIRQRSVFFMLHCSMLTAVQFLSLIEFSGLKKLKADLKIAMLGCDLYFGLRHGPLAHVVGWCTTTS